MSHLTSIVKVVLLIASGLAHNYGLRPPIPPTPKDAKTVYRGQYFEKVVLVWATMTRTVIMALSISSSATILLLSFPIVDAYMPYLFDSFCPYPSSTISSLQALSWSFVLGVVGMVIGSLIRGWCFSTLGQLFTYHVALTRDHSLVTHGPYAYVRHPSYTGVFVMLLSTVQLYLLSYGNYVMECGILGTPWKWLAWYWGFCFVVTFTSLYRRGKVEDDLMKGAFLDQWVLYRERVRYSFVPYII